MFVFFFVSGEISPDFDVEKYDFNLIYTKDSSPLLMGKKMIQILWKFEKN
jgi:hypothetical protein